MLKNTIRKVKEMTAIISKDQVSTYAAQSAFFMMLSLIPIVMLLMTAVRLTPVTQDDVIRVIYEFFPKTIRGTIQSIVTEVYAQTSATLSLSVVMVLWSASRSVLAISSGLNHINGQKETRNFILLRIRASFYTVLFIMAIILSLVILGFGNSISMMIRQYVPMFGYITEYVIEVRTVVAFSTLMIFAIAIYKFLPNGKKRLQYQLPGAIFTALGWMLASFVISIYMDVFQGFSNVYGSLTTIILIMLWIYFCMYIILLGGELNKWATEYLEKN